MHEHFFFNFILCRDFCFEILSYDFFFTLTGYKSKDKKYINASPKYVAIDDVFMMIFFFIKHELPAFRSLEPIYNSSVTDTLMYVTATSRLFGVLAYTKEMSNYANKLIIDTRITILYLRQTRILSIKDSPVTLESINVLKAK